ncbi:MAG: ABC transporter permease subunit [Chloroflexi bacterium]|jgi:ABC-2 type transport system permease protein|nr:ABC transporter permease subunit [Chloroflexota bacterium]
MRNIWTIAKREYLHYFSTPIAYVVAFLLLLTVGILFVLNIVYYANNAMFGGGAPSPNLVTGPFAFLLLLSVPALTMRLISDENRMGTLELLLTAPVTDWELVVGKWLGAFLFLLTILALTLIYPLLLNIMVKPGIDFMLALSAYLGVILVAAALLGLGTGISALFSNPIASFFMTLAVFVVLWWLIGAPASVLSTGTELFSYLDMSNHFYDSFNQGVIKLTDLVYYLSLTLLGLFIGATAIEVRRWQ